MPRGRRPKFSRQFYYHVYNRGNWKFPIFFQTADYLFFLNKMDRLSSRQFCNIEVRAFCLMDNHYHLVLKQRSPVSISKFIQRLSISYSMYLNIKYKHPGHTFQGRFHARPLRSQTELKRLLEYIKENPMKAGYVNHWEKYRWVDVGTDLRGDGPHDRHTK